MVVDAPSAMNSSDASYGQQFDATIVITTHGRHRDLRAALVSCRQQSDVKLEVLVYDDASTDITADMVRHEFPEVKLFRSETRRGYIAHRNQGYRDARGAIVFSLDDDATFSSPTSVKDILQFFEHSPKVGAVAIAFTEPLRNPTGAMQSLPSGTKLRNFVGCAHAVKREVFSLIGGYPEFLVHQGEERDFSIQLLDAGYDIVFANIDPIVHHVSPARDTRRMHHFGYRNTILFPWMRFPFEFALARIVTSSVQLLAHRFSLRRLPVALLGLIAGYLACFRYWSERQPVRRRTYRLYRSLPAHGPMAGSTEKLSSKSITK